MKKLLLLPLALAFATNAANAAQTADLTVSGTILPPACNVSLTGGAFTLASINGEDLNKAASTTLAETAPKTLDITCTGTATLSFKIVDNQLSSVPVAVADADVAYGLGKDNAQSPIGFYTIEVDTATVSVNAGPGFIFESVDDGMSWTEVVAADESLKKFDTATALYCFNTASRTSVANVSSVQIALSVIPTIEATDTLDMSADITLSGSSTIELVYL